MSGAWHDEWRITGDPTVIVEGVECAFPSYLFVYDSRDDRWPGEQAEAQARAWVAQRGSDRLGWRDGPFLHHRRVFIGEWTPDVTTGIARAAAWEKAERYAGRAGGEPEVEYWVVAAHGDLWGERRYDDIAEARQKAERCQADGDEVRICKVTVTRTRDWVARNWRFDQHHERTRIMKVWECKIGSRDGKPLASPADPPMREAIARAYREITGQEAEFVFSGWGSRLTEEELAVVEHRDPATLYPCPFCGAEATKPCQGLAGEDAGDICGARMDLVR